MDEADAREARQHSSPEVGSLPSNNGLELQIPEFTVAKIMTNALKTPISDEAKRVVQSIATEFIGCLTSEAADMVPIIEGRTRDITHEHIRAACENLGFDEEARVRTALGISRLYIAVKKLQLTFMAASRLCPALDLT